jgi:hypothetical protein
MKPRITFEPIPGDKDALKQSADGALATLKSLFKDEDYKPALELVKQLEAVVAAYVTTIKVCDDAIEAQGSLAKVLDNFNAGTLKGQDLVNQYQEKLKPAKDKFKLLHERITAHYALGHNKVPPIPAGMKIPQEMLTRLEEFRKRVGAFKTWGDKYYKQAEEVNGKIIDLSNTIISGVANSKPAQVAPAPASSNVKSPNFMYSNQAAQAKASAANKPVQPSAPENPNAKK